MSESILCWKLSLHLAESEDCTPGLSHNQHFSEHRMLKVYFYGAILVPTGSKDKISMMLVHMATLPPHSAQTCDMGKVYKLLRTGRSALSPFLTHQQIANKLYHKNKIQT